MTEHTRCRLGAHHLGEGRTQFLVWAPKASAVELELVEPRGQRIAMEQLNRGYFHALVEGVEPGARYFYRLNESAQRPDPASRFQPEGVHGPSQVIEPRFAWRDDHWHGIPLRDYILYELHVGTFTPEGTFESIIPRLGYLKELGITAIELLPVAQFAGSRNWGYDGVYPYATQTSYGGPDGLRKLIDACHREGFAVVMDVVYNHLGPEGNYLGEFGYYFTDKYHTPWGSAINFDGQDCDEVRRYFIENAVFWIRDFHIDALRLDAVHAIYDESARPFLRELAEAVRATGERVNRRVYAIAESNKNDSRHVQPVELGGFALDAQWNDDFHHIVHVLFTHENSGYYADFRDLSELAKAYREGFVYTGQWSPFRQRRHGVSSYTLGETKFVVFTQNHDQVGNRLNGERLSALLSFEEQKLAAGLLLLSPYVPLLFMGEEYGEKAPFLYFVSHTDEQLVEAVRKGRREEFVDFGWQGAIPDPQSEETFQQSKLKLDLHRQEPHSKLFALYQQLIRMRKTIPALAHAGKHDMDVVVHADQHVMSVRRYTTGSELQAFFHLDNKPCSLRLPLQAGVWTTALDSSSPSWAGPGSSVPDQISSDGTVQLELAPSSFVVLLRKGA